MQLRDFREQLGVSLGDAARAIGIGKATLSCIERKTQKPSLATAMAIEAWAKDMGPVQLDWSWTAKRRKGARKGKKR